MSNGADTIYRPGVAVISRANPAADGVPTDTTVGFIVGEASQGPVGTPTLVNSLDQHVGIYGGRLAVSPYLYDGVEMFFREGGGSLYVSRLAEGAAVAHVAAPDFGTEADLAAASPGDLRQRNQPRGRPCSRSERARDQGRHQGGYRVKGQERRRRQPHTGSEGAAAEAARVRRRAGRR